jgi:hypothetical protein
MVIALTTTITTTHTATTATALGASQAAMYGALISAIILNMLLIAKLLLSSYVAETDGLKAEDGGVLMMNTKAKSLADNLSTAIYPLLFGFSLIVMINVLEVL